MIYLIKIYTRGIILLLIPLLYTFPVIWCNIEPAGVRTAPDSLFSVGQRRELELAMEQVLDFPYQNVSDHAKFDWKVGTYFTGVMEAFAATGNPKFYQAAKKWSEDRKWKIRGTPLFADNLCLGQIYARLYLLDKNPEMISDLKLKLEPYFSREKILKKELYTKWTESERDFTGRNVWWWIDSLYMAPPLFVYMYQATGEQRYLDQLHKFYWDVVDYLYDREEKLFFRDLEYLKAKTPNGKKVFWSRGNGWVYAGLVHIIDNLPMNDSRRADYLKLYLELTESIIKYQGGDGLWRSSLNESEWFPEKESSGSSFFCYGLLAGVHRGWLSREQYLSPALKAWRGLQGCLDHRGWMGHAQIEAERPGPAMAGEFIDYTQGTYLLAAAELYKLNLHGERTTGPQDRAYLVKVMTRIGGPVLEGFSQNQFKTRFPVRDWEKGRSDSSALEAFTRTLAGMAPWLELGGDTTPEGHLRDKYGRLARQALINATDPGAADYLSFGLYKQAGPQALVEAAYLAHALLRAPKVLWEPLSAEQKINVLQSLKTTRAYKPYENNWLLFPAMVEVACWVLDGDVQRSAIEVAVKKHQEWYKGDGTYGDGHEFHWDYYNSYVMQPMMLEVLRVCREKKDPLGDLYDEQLRRAQRYATVLERMISPEGTFPVVGRSSSYRFAAFQGLSQVILVHQLPAQVRPAGARAGLTTVVRRMMEAPGTLDENGWLDIGAVGRQPSIRDFYNNSGALYMCLTGLIHLGLPASDSFWQAPAEPWTQQRIWASEDIPNDHALKKN